MRFFLKFKWVFLFIGLRIAGGRGAVFGFLLGWFIDSLLSPPTIRFRVYTNYTNANQQQWGSGAGSADSYSHYDSGLDEAYSILEINKTASDDEVRQAYRRMALKYHPDRIASQGESARLAAEHAFQRINQAKERIFKARGIK